MRVDVYLTEFGYAPSRRRAQEWIANGAVTVDGKTVAKPSAVLDETVPHTVETDTSLRERYVSRGGNKLEAALDAFGVSPAGKYCLDIGASTGGFTDCLLQRGAVHVVDIDVGERQLDASLCGDSRITNLEHYNARNLSLADVGGRAFDVIVLDVSFISQTLILPRIPEVLAENGVYIGLVKPQFEAGKSAIGKGGIVKNPEDRVSAAERVYDTAVSVGLCPVGWISSPILGGDGNREYLIYLTRAQNAPRLTKEELARRVRSNV